MVTTYLVAFGLMAGGLLCLASIVLDVLGPRILSYHRIVQHHAMCQRLMVLGLVLFCGTWAVGWLLLR